MHALLWYYTNNKKHAEAAIKIMNAWSYKLKGGHSGIQCILQSGWVGAVWPKAAEIIRYTYTGWNESDVKKFESMLTKQFLPSMKLDPVKCYNNNWINIVYEARLNIAVFTDNKELFLSTLKSWKQLVESSFYLEEDGKLPKQSELCKRTDKAMVKHWHDPKKFVSGLAQETCRDLGHTAYSIASLCSMAETAFIQDIDLYALEKDRLVEGMEFNARIENNNKTENLPCHPRPTLNGTMAICYNHFVNRLGLSMPETERLQQKRWSHSGWFHFLYEGLTSLGPANQQPESREAE